MDKAKATGKRRWLSPPQMHPAKQYGLAAMATVCALGIALLLPYRQTNPVFVFFIMAVAAGTWAGGVAVGLFASVLSLGEAIYFLLPSELNTAHPGQWMRLLNVAALCVLTAIAVGWLRRVVRRNADWMAFAEESPNPILRIGRNQRVLYLNGAAESLLTAENGAAETVPPELWKLAEDVFHTGKEYAGEFTCRNGRIFTFSCLPAAPKGRVSMYGRDVTEARHAEQALRYQLELNQNITDKAADSIFVTDVQDRVLFMNPEAEKVFGFSRNELLGKALHDSIHHHHPNGRLFPRSECHSINVYGGETVRHYEEVFFRKDGASITVSCSAAPVEVNGKRTGTVLVVHDISDRKQKEEQLQKLHRTFNALNNANQALLRATNEALLLEQVCQIITRDCGYLMAWIGFAEDDAEKSVRPVAYAGLEEGYLGALHLTWADTERGQGPTGTAIRTGQTSACRDMLTNPRFELWREQAQKRGYSSWLAIPLLLEGKAFGAITIYSRESDPFTKDEVELLEELAGNLSFGIGALRLRAARKQVQEALRIATARAEAESEQLQAVFNSMTEGVIVTDARRNVLYYNPSALQLHGFEKPAEATVPVQDYEKLFEFREMTGKPVQVEQWPVARVLRGEVVREYHLRVHRKDTDKWFVGSYNGTRIEDASGNVKLAMVTLRDVTAQTRAEEALRESNERFLLLARGTRDGIWDWKLEHGEFWWNEAYDELFGKRPPETRNDPEWWLDHIHPDDAEYVRTTFAGALAGGQSQLSCEYRYRRPDGSYVNVLDRAYIYRNEQGKAIRVTGSMQDITDRKRAEEALRQSEEQLRVAALAAEIGVWSWKPGTANVVVSANWRRLFGVAPQVKVTFDTWVKALHPEDRTHAVEELHAAIREGREFDTEYRVVWPDGTVRWIVDRGRAFYGEHGTAVGMSGINLDITERRKAEEELRNSEERLRALANAIPNIAWSADGDGQVDFVNDWWYQYTGMTARESLGRGDFLKAMHPDDVGPARLRWREAVRNGTPYEIEYRFRRLDGSYRWHLGRGVPVRNAHGKIVRWFGTCTDIEDFKRAQEALVRSEKLASTGRMAATIAHEINNPLAAAMNAVYLARMDKTLSPQTGELLATVDEELLRAAQITRQTLGFYRENGQREPVQVAEVAESVLELYAKRLVNKGVRVTRNYRPTPAALASTGELRQVVANLVANAVDACSEGGELHVRTATVRQWVVVTVADTGCGIAAEHRERLFEPFFTTKDALGTGLGLWVSHELVKKHGGRIRVRSQAGKGTVFAIYLPVADKGAAASSN